MKPYFVLAIRKGEITHVHTAADAKAAHEWLEVHGSGEYRYVFAKWASGPFVVERVIRKTTGEIK